MSPLKSFGAVALMIACFVAVYPRFMHPFVMSTLGLSQPPNKDAEDNMYPPHFKAMHPGATKRPAAADEARKQMRSFLTRVDATLEQDATHRRAFNEFFPPLLVVAVSFSQIQDYSFTVYQSPPHPGMRAAAEMQKQQAQQGSGRGMMGVVLPMYAIGIVLYLLYTLFKVFNKSKDDSWNESSSYENRLDGDYPVDRMGLPADYDGVGDIHNIYNDDRQRKHLEHLLTRIDDKNVSVDEMRMLQKRLEETEAQMCRILKAMHSVHSNVDKMDVAEDLGESKGNSDDLNPGMNNSEVGEEKGDINEKQVKHVADEKENGRKQNLQTKDEDEPSGLDHKKEACGSGNLQQDVVSDDIDNGDEQEVECGNQDREEMLTSTEKIEDTGDKKKLNTGTKVRQRKGKHDIEQ